jgi:hypothetical protein
MGIRPVRAPASTGHAVLPLDRSACLDLALDVGPDPRSRLVVIVVVLPVLEPAVDLPGELPVTWDEQVQAAADCFEAGARIWHIHVRDPKTGKISKNFADYSAQIGRLREAVPDMVLQIAPKLIGRLGTRDNSLL